MRKFFFLIFTLIILTFISCENSPSIINKAKGICVLTITEDKKLVTDVNSKVTEYLYKAEPQFEGASGAEEEWAHLSYNGKGEIGLLTQGKWKFSLQGRNTTGTVITTGETVSYIEAGKENIVEIQMKTDSSIGTGSVSYAVWTQNVTAEGSVLKVYERVTGTTSWTFLAEHSNSNETEHVRFNGSATALSAGWHEMLFLLFDKSGASLGGEQIGVQIVAGHDTAVSGIIEPSQEVGLKLTIKSMGYVHGLLSPNSDILVEGTGRDRVAYMERGDSVTFTWEDLSDASSIPTEWIWAFDGAIVNGVTGNSYTVSFDKYGEHELSVIGIRRDSEGKAWDAGSAVIRIVVVRHICEITFLANGGFYSNGTDVCIIKEDTTLAESREVPGGQPYDGLSPQRTGYVLTGWKDTETGKLVATVKKDGTVMFLDEFVTKKDTRTLSAVWEAGEYTLTVVWGENVTANNKSVAYSTTHKIACGDKLSVLDSKASRRGFKFLGYSTEENARGEVKTASDIYSWGRDITLYANWEYIPIQVGFYKSYSDYQSGKKPYKYIEVGSDLRYGSLPQPLRQGKVFKGWAQPEDVNANEKETINGETYLTNNALKDGKTFVQVDSMVRKYEDHVLVAVWGEGTIKISFNYGNATLTQEGKASLSNYSKDTTGNYYKMGALGTMYGSLPFTGIETNVREGWEFMGWYDSPSYSLRVYEVSAVSEPMDHTLYAKWEGKKVYVSFSSGISEVFPNKEVRYNGVYGTLPLPQRPGYIFKGWWYNGVEITSSSYVETDSSHTLVAKWEAIESEITLFPNGGEWSYPTKMTIKYDDSYSKAKSGGTTFASSSTADGLKNPSRYGYDFSGWYSNITGSGERIKGTTINHETEDQSLYAIWTSHKHTIKFVYNWPGTTSEPATTTSASIAFGSSYGTLPLPKYTGYTFNGWYTSSTGGERVQSSTKFDVDEDIVLYGRWSIQKINVSFYDSGVICRDKDGVALSPIQVTWGSLYGTLPTPYRKGYKATGRWVVVGKTAEDGSAIYIDEKSKVTVTEDITVSPIWEPLEILVAFSLDSDVSDNGVVASFDLESITYRSITYGTAINTMKKVNMSAGTWTTTNQSLASPRYTKTGFYQEGWKLVIPNRSVTLTNESAMLWDYGEADSLFTSQIGILNPNQMIYLFPNWKPEQYNVSFTSLLETTTGITTASNAPSFQTKTATYMDSMRTIMGSSNMLDWSPEWSGYVCTGFYLDRELTKPLTAESVFGVDITTTNGNIVIYVKWMKSRTEYRFSTSSSLLYPEGSPDVLFSVEDMFKGNNDGQLSGKPGWYTFTGNVDEKTFTNGKVRIGGEDVSLILVEGDAYGKTLSNTWTAPMDMEIEITTYNVPYFDYYFTCSTCGGKGYKGHVDKTEYINETRSDYIPTEYASKYSSYVYEEKYVGTNAYDNCAYSKGRGCYNWPNGHWEEVTCPTCNGNPNSVSSSNEGWYEYTHTVTNTETVTTTDPETGEEITEEVEVKEEVTELYYTTVYCICQNSDFEGYCGKPGKVKLQTYSSLGREYGEINVYVNGTLIRSNEATTRNAYGRCLNPSLRDGVGLGALGAHEKAEYTDTCHYDNSVWDGWLIYNEVYCSACEGKRATVRNGNVYKTAGTISSKKLNVAAGDVVKVEMTLPALKEDTYIKVTPTKGKVEIKDIDNTFTSNVVIADTNGTNIPLGYDFYTQSAGKYFTTAITNVIATPETKYKSYSGAVLENTWALINLPGEGETPSMTSLSTIGNISSDMIDTSRPATFNCTLSNGSVLSGALGDSGTGVIWTDGMIQITYKDTSGIKTYTYNRRQAGRGINNAVKNLELNFWLKE